MYAKRIKQAHRLNRATGSTLSLKSFAKLSKEGQAWLAGKATRPVKTKHPKRVKGAKPKAKQGGEAKDKKTKGGK